MADTSRIIVVLENGVHMEQAERIASAISQLSGVAGAMAIEAASDDAIALLKARSEVRDAVYAALEPIFFSDRKR